MIYISSSCFKNNGNIFNIIEAYSNSGIKNMELGSSHYFTEKLFKKLLYYNSKKLNFLIHNYFPPPKTPFVLNLASQNETLLKKSITQVKRAIRLCKKLNIKFYTFHAGYAQDPDINFNFNKNKEVDYEASFRLFLRTIKNIGEYAKKHKVRLGIENNPSYTFFGDVSKFTLMTSLENFKEFFDKIEPKNLGILLDLGHLKVSANRLKFNRLNFVKDLKEKVLAVHVHENNGKIDSHEGLNRGSWCFGVIKKYFKEKPIILESTRQNLKKILSDRALLERSIK